jgi:hypothetical protein
MRALSLDFADQGFDARPQPGHGVDQQPGHGVDQRPG